MRQQRGRCTESSLREGWEEKGESPLSDVVGQAVLGGEEMLGKVKSLVGGKQIGQDVVERKRFKDAPGAEEIISAVESVVGMDKGMITERGRKGNEGRKLALYLGEAL